MCELKLSILTAHSYLYPFQSIWKIQHFSVLFLEILYHFLGFSSIRGVKTVSGRTNHRYTSGSSRTCLCRRAIYSYGGTVLTEKTHSWRMKIQRGDNTYRSIILKRPSRILIIAGSSHGVTQPYHRWKPENINTIFIYIYIYIYTCI